jgi:outer membrane protein TolC
MKYILTAIGIYSFIFNTTAQTGSLLKISDCYNLAKQHYPLSKKQELIQKSAAYSIENAATAFLPQVNINGQATYQSDVTEVPIKLPNASIPTISKDQYKVYAEVNQVLFDGGITRLQKQSIQANAVVEQQQLEVELYKLKERINQLFFGILLIDEQLVQSAILRKDIESGLSKTNAAIANGIALKTNAQVLQAELMRNDQRNIELKSMRAAYIEMLSQFINQPLNENSMLEKPSIISARTAINRPELLLFDAQKKMITVRSKIINAKNSPRIGLFAQGGYGRPALNMLKNDFSGYYIGGVRFSWSLSGLYTAKKEKALLSIDDRSIDIQKETFLFNTNLAVKQQNAEITKLNDLVNSDNGIIELREKIKNTSLVQLENGVINSNDYLREVNAADQARESQSLHKIQLLSVQYNQQTTTGN